ncbi:hypothetical protein SUGI_0537950 [Cryptomeria japonica]|nr:hypothetical protein SUGI_0537950 [Cryptomeria japonica]
MSLLPFCSGGPRMTNRSKSGLAWQAVVVLLELGDYEERREDLFGLFHLYIIMGNHHCRHWQQLKWAFLFAKDDEG